MTYSTTLRNAVCLAALIAGSTAQADVTAAQVWDDWKSQLTLYGEDNISIGAEETSSGTVTVRDLTLSFADDDVAVEAEFGDIMFNEQSGGTVRVTMDDSFPVVMTADDGTVVNMLVSQTNLEMLISGDPDAMNYAISADEYKFAMVDIVNGDLTYNGDAALSATNVTANYDTTIGDTRETSYSGSIDLLDLIMDFQIPGGNGDYVTAAAKYNDMTMQGEVSMPVDADFSDPDTLISDGFAIAGGYTVASTDFVMDVQSEGEQIAASGGAGETVFTGNMSNAGLAYDAEVTDMKVSVQTTQFPLPIDISMAKYGIGVEVPTGQSDTAAPFGISFDMIDLNISDALWDLFDPTAVLPRAPATIQFAIAGQAKALYDMFDPDQQANLESMEVPYELETLTLETLNIDVAGARVVGEGAFTFDNTDTQTFAPLPRPLGDAVIEITGLNAFLDNLVTMGVVPEADVMGPRMMMGMFARSTGDDQMEIAVEVNDAGEVMVNGNRVR